jgi:hypothetical protein
MVQWAAHHLQVQRVGKLDVIDVDRFARHMAQAIAPQ